MSATLVDILLVAFLGHALWRGWRRGLIRGVAKIVGLIVASVAAALLHAPVADLVSGLGVPERYDDLVAAVAVFAAVIIGFRFAGDAIAKTLRATKIGGLVDQGAGAALSGVWALALAALVLTGISLFDGSAAARAVDESALGDGIVETAPEVASGLAGADFRRWLTGILQPSS